MQNLGLEQPQPWADWAVQLHQVISLRGRWQEIPGCLEVVELSPPPALPLWHHAQLLRLLVSRTTLPAAQLARAATISVGSSARGQGLQGWAALPSSLAQWHARLQGLFLLLRKARGCPPSYPAGCGQRQMRKQASGQQAAGLTPLSLATGLSSHPGQHVGESGMPPSPSSGQVPSRVGILRHAPPPLHGPPPMLKPALG